MAASIEIDAQGEHQYVVRLTDGVATCESWFTITPAVLEEVRAPGESEEQVVARTAQFLAARQDVADFPGIVDLEDVIAAYADYPDFMAR